MRRMFLLGGIALLVAGSALAGQRTRGGEPTLRGDAGPDSAFGAEITFRADGMVSLEQVLADFGTTERYFGALHTGGTASYLLEDGTRLFADGNVGYFPDLLGTDYGDVAWQTVTPEAIEARKQAATWAETDEGGAPFLVFADGNTTFGLDQREPGIESRSQVPSVVNGTEVLYADGMVRAP